MCEIWTYVRKDRLEVSIEKEITDFFFFKCKGLLNKKDIIFLMEKRNKIIHMSSSTCSKTKSKFEIRNMNTHFYKTNSQKATSFIYLIHNIVVGSEFEYFYCYVNKLKSNRPNTINFVDNGFKNWVLVRIATTGHDCK